MSSSGLPPVCRWEDVSAPRGAVHVIHGLAEHPIVFDRYNAPFGPKAPPNTWLSRDEDEVFRYNNDDRCGFPLTAQAWLDLLSARLAQSIPAFYRRIPSGLPVYVIAGTADPVGESGKGVLRLLSALSDAGLSRVSHRMYAGARHELINEINREEVTEELISWFNAVVRT